MSINTIIKSDGTRVPFDPEKLNKWGEYASANDVSWSAITLDAYRKCYDGCTTKDIQQAMIDSCVEREDAKHLRMAGRLLIGAIYKEAHGGFKSIPNLKDFYHKMVGQNTWGEMDYTDEELMELNEALDHDKNMSENYSYTALKQMRDKYLAQDLVNRVCHESPQFMFMGVAMQAYENLDKKVRIDMVKSLYKHLSDLKINVSTPMLVNLRTPKKGLASCCVYTTEDTADSLSVGDHIAYMMTCASAGIGSHLTTRSKGDPIRNGVVVHQGKLPYLRMIQSAVHANKQACYDDQTEVLTSKGFKFFNELTEDDLVAQVLEDGKVEFVIPDNYFTYDFKGELVSFQRPHTDAIVVTDNHTMVYSETGSLTSDEFEENEEKLFHTEEAGKFETDLTRSFKVSGEINNLNSDKVSNNDLLATLLLFFQEFAFEDKENTVIGIDLTTDYLERIYDFMVAYQTSNDKEGEFFLSELVEDEDIGDSHTFVIKMDTSSYKSIMSKFDTILERLGAPMINELLGFISYINNDEIFAKSEKELNFLLSLTSLSNKTIEFSEVEEDELGIGGGYRCVVNTMNSTFINTLQYNKTLVPYDGKVYCVEVPTNKLIVKRGLETLVCGNSRGGANTTYFSVLDPEIMDLLVLKNPTTVLQKRIRDIDYALNVNKLFVEKVARNEEWYTLSYYYAPDLHDAFYSSDYDLFKELYEKYKTHEHAVEYKARDLAIKAVTESVETGRLYMCYIDEMNRHTPFKVGSGANDDKIYSSNLCVAPETEILTDEGYKQISTLKDKDVNVWNGQEWSQVTVRQTGEDRLLMKIGFSNGTIIECTYEHKFYIKENNGETRAIDVSVQDTLETFNIDGVSYDDVTVTSIELTGRRDDTYCATEPKRNRLIFNGIETGNCLEISLPTKGFTDMMDLYSDNPTGEIGLCSLSSIVQGRVTDEEYEDVAFHTVLMVDQTIDIMDYPFPALASTAKKRRSIGIGMTNLAHDMASKGHRYTSKEGKDYIHQVAERHAYWLYRASLRVAKMLGNAEWMHKTKLPDGWLPVDTYNKNVDTITTIPYTYDWEGLRKDIIEQGGIRNSTLIAIPPNESSSLLTNTTNSIYPIRSLKVIKTSGTNRNILLAPDMDKLANKYDIAWDIPSKDLIELYAIVQKFTDQGISADLYVSYQDSQLVSSKELLTDFINMMRLGCKSRYYINSRSGVDTSYIKRNEAEVINTDDQCEACVL